MPKLALRYGMTDAEFVSMAAPGGSMISAELCATGLVGVILHAAELHGEQVDWPTGLAKIGLSAEGLPTKGQPLQSTPAPEVQKPTVPVGAGDVLAKAEAVEEVVKAIRTEYESLGTFQKQRYKRTLRHRTGMDVEDCEKAAHNGVEALRHEGGTRELAPDYIIKLRGLAEHFIKSESDWRPTLRTRSSSPTGSRSSNSAGQPSSR